MVKKIMIVRHGEKPDKNRDVRGVDADGGHDKNDLSPQGWQRSGALIRFFHPTSGQYSHPALAKPDAVFAAAPAGHVQSLRSKNTVESVADSLHVRLNLKFTKGDENKLVQEVLATSGVVLIAWEHKAILDIARMILGNAQSSPQNWPDSRFDLVWVFDAPAEQTGWRFTQVPQLLLPHDSPHVL